MASQEKDGQSRLKKLQKVRVLEAEKHQPFRFFRGGWLENPSFRDDFLIKEPWFLGDSPQPRLSTRGYVQWKIVDWTNHWDCIRQFMAFQQSKSGIQRMHSRYGFVPKWDSQFYGLSIGNMIFIWDIFEEGLVGGIEWTTWLTEVDLTIFDLPKHCSGGFNTEPSEFGW